MEKPSITNNYYAPIGQQIAHVDKIEAHFDRNMGMEIANAEGSVGQVSADVALQADHGVANRDSAAGGEELFHFIHPEVEDSQELKIHQSVKKLVRRFGVKEICDYLAQMAKEKKILLPHKPSVAYDELVRMGMPSDEGYAMKTFEKYYRK